MASEGRNFSLERKRAITSATDEQRQACALAYAEHCRLCINSHIAPTPFDTFFFEWLEIERQPKESASGDSAESGNYPARDYDRMFYGKRGWD